MKANHETSELTGSNSVKLIIHQWIPDNCRGIVQVIHGLSEHGKRYEPLAMELNEAGWGMVVHDQQGHGLSLGKDDTPGHVESKRIWLDLLDDIRLVRDQIIQRFPNKSHVLFGHSMGAILSIASLENGFQCNGLIASALAPSQPFLTGLGQGIAMIQKRLFGAAHPSKLLVFASFGIYNLQFKPNRTAFDWLSRDEHQVDQYVNDPFCGHNPSVHFFRELFDGLTGIYKSKNLKNLPSDLPVLMYAGSEDPVAGNEKGMMRTLDTFRKYWSELDWKIYPGGRHEMHNETNREEVVADLITWLNDHFES